MSLDQNIKAGFTAVGTKVKEINNSLIDLDSSVVKKINGISPVQGNVNIEMASGIHIGASEPEGNESVWVDTDENAPKSFNLGSIKDGQELTLRKGTSSDHSTFTGAVGELTYNITEGRIVTHDGSTIGGIPMAKKSEVDAIDVGVTSFNGSKGAITYSAPVTSVDGLTGAINLSSKYQPKGNYLTSAPVSSVNGKTGAVNIDVGVTSINGQKGDLSPAQLGCVSTSGGLIEGGITVRSDIHLEPTTSEGGQMVFMPALDDQTSSGVFVDTAWGQFRIFGHPSRDGVTRTGVGRVLCYDPYANAFFIDGQHIVRSVNGVNADVSGNVVISDSTKIPLSGSRGTLAGYNTPTSSSNAVTISNTSNDDTIVTAAVSVTINNGASGQTWTKTVALQNASATVTLGSAWKWVGGSAPTISANSILVVKWCGTFGLANLIAGA